jgi:DNA polymerase-3 subunit alpha
MAQLDGAMARASSIAADRVRGQSSLFDAFESTPSPATKAKAVELPEWPTSEKLSYEKELLGMYLTGHPLQPYEPLIRRFAAHTIADLPTLENRAMTRVGGLVSALQEGISKKSGKKYAMVTIEDLTGSVQMLLMNENYDRFRSLLNINVPVLVTAEVNTGEDRPKLFPQEILRLEEAPRKFTRQVHVRLQADAVDAVRLEALRTLIEEHRGKIPLFLNLRMANGATAYLEANDQFYVTPSAQLEEAINASIGADAYWTRVDTSLPERAPRKWERRGSGDDG